MNINWLIHSVQRSLIHLVISRTFRYVPTFLIVGIILIIYLLMRRR